MGVRLDWRLIDTVLLDMDGTLLDLRFDDHFWREHVPAAWGRARGLDAGSARRDLLGRYRAHEGTLDWYDVDFWSRSLGLDIRSLQREVDHLIAVHPYVVSFLERVRGGGRAVCLVTNAHRAVLDLKMEKTALAEHFDAIVTSHDVGLPKEDVRFWEALGERVPFEPGRTLLAEDTLTVLDAAAAHGIAHLVHVVRPSSAGGVSPDGPFPTIEYFSEIMPPDAAGGERT